MRRRGGYCGVGTALLLRFIKHYFVITSYSIHYTKLYDLRSCPDDSYTLKLDIRKFFYSIDRRRLKKLIEKKIKDRRLVEAMMLFADMETNKGIPIGNLLSQIYALIYLNPLDHFIKRVLKVKRYVRYVDDFILIGIIV